MEKCTNCRGEGLVHQGESIHKVCGDCKGTGKVGELLEVTQETKMDEEVIPAEEAVVEEESFLGDAGESSEEVAPASEEEVA